MKTQQHGNVLFIILIAIALFASLAYAVSKSSYSGKNIDDEELSIQASRVLETVREFSTSVRRLRSIGDCSKNDISFHHNDWGHNDYLHSPVQTSECRIFESGEMRFIQPNAEWLDSSQSAEAEYGNFLFYEQACIELVGTGGLTPSCDSTDSSDEELIMFIPWITKELCIEINKKLDLTNPAGSPPAEKSDSYDPAISTHKFNGNYTQNYSIGGDLEAANLNRQATGCFEGNSGASTPPSGTYHFYHILIAR